jgi:glycosyltransferase involved in cell wall biosynthesis
MLLRAYSDSFLVRVFFSRVNPVQKKVTMSETAPISVVIAAHNEAAVLGRCLEALLAHACPGELDIVVAANGCTDATAEVAARRPGVRVIELPAPGKAAALNAGDQFAVGYPRVYLDADIVLPLSSLRAMRAALADADAADGRVLAAAPRRYVDARRSPVVVRAYYAISSRLPAFTGALFGRGAIMLSAAGRARFGQFPNVLADDLFLDSLFAAQEKIQVDAVISRVLAPRSTADLMRRLVRVRRANSRLRARPPGQRAGDCGQVRRPARWAWLRVAAARPWLLPAAACYAAISCAAALAASAPQRLPDHWGRDNSSRAASTGQ